MKQNKIASLMRPGFANMAVNSRVNLCLWAGRSIALCALLTHSLSSAQATDALPGKEPGSQITPAQKPAYTPQGHQMKRYKAFARQAEMPAITVIDKTTLEIGGAVRTDLNRLARLSPEDGTALAGQFGVPAGVIGKVAERSVNTPPPDATRLAQDIRTAVIDYRFLQGEWKRYNPTADGQKVKADALQALQVGDISKAWELYDGLQRPLPPLLPTNPRVVSQR